MVTSFSLAGETANRVLVDDMQTVVRENAQSALSRATTAELNAYVDKRGNPLPREEIERQYLTNAATEELSVSSSVGYTGSINDAVNQQPRCLRMCILSPKRTALKSLM